MKSPIVPLMLASLLLVTGPFWPVDHSWGVALADDHADDDDDDDDDDRPVRRDNDDDDDDRPVRRDNDDDDDDDRPVRRDNDDDDDDRTLAPTPPRGDDPPVEAAPPRPRPVAEPAAVPLPLRAENEIVVANLSAEDLAALIAQGFTLIEQRDHPRIGQTLFRLQTPSDLTDDAAREAVRALPSGANADFNHYYRAGEGDEPAGNPVCEGMHCPAHEQIGWPMVSARTPLCRDGADIRVGMVDTGLNADHATFAEARLSVLRLADDAQDPSRAVHGTAVAAILIGDPGSRSPGLIPHAELVAVDVFHRADGDERTDALALADGLAHLVEQGARVINLSLAGPDNSFLAGQVRDAILTHGIVIVAAAGNEGPASPPVYPAGWADVLAVTAVSVDGDIYRRANRGDHIDFAAPGVGIWTAASVEGARDKTGTSFAVPFVTAMVVQLLERNPALSPAEVVAILADTADDLGEPGRDPTFGHGLVRYQGECGRGDSNPAAP